MPSFERFVIQRKSKGGAFLDWTNPMNGQVEYLSHGHAVAALLRRANAVDFRIIKRTYTWVDEPVRAYL